MGLICSSAFHLFQTLRLRTSDSNGFTLPELLIGSALTSVALLLAGAGLNSVLSSSLIGSTENEQRVELSRA